MKKKRLTILALVLCMAMVLGMMSGCGNDNAAGSPAPGGSTAPSGSTEPKGSEPAGPAEPEGTVEVTFWVSFGEALQQALTTHIDTFNASQDKYHVTMEFQGSASDLMAKLGATVQSELPTMYTGAVEHTGFFASSGFTRPLQELVDQYGDWDYSSTYPHLISAYSNGAGQLMGYPLGNSFAGIFVNMDIFNAAGIDPYEMKSMQDVYEVAKQLKEGGYCDYGVGFHPNGYYMNASLAVEGVDSVDAGNGYDGRATECLYNTGATKAAMEAMLGAYQNIYKDGVGVVYGTDMNTEVIPLFGEGKCAMFLGVISTYARIVTAMGDNPFDVGLVSMVGCSDNSRSTGVPAAGTGIFVCNNGDDASQRGAYEFIKYLSQADQVAQWSIDTGYLPVTADGAATAAYQAYLKDHFPRAQACLDAQKNGDSTTRTPYLPIANEVLAANKLAVEKVANDPNCSVEQVIEEATSTINEALELYNLANPE